MTPHIEAKENEIAKTVIMPGDPLRAQYIALNYLENYKLVNQIRGMYAYTGFYKGKKITVMASGMGMPSIGIYSYELFNFYNVENIIRVGSCGTYTNDLTLSDIILVKEAYSDSSYAYVQNGYDKKIIESDNSLNNKITSVADVKIYQGVIHSTDVFYNNADINKLYKEHKCLGVEMESFALFHNAKVLNKKAACLLTVSDNLITYQKMTPLERQNSFDKMIKIALDSVL
ncbi:MAG: purine-nucleoside phosphorylase [Bacilli bacterium]